MRRKTVVLDDDPTGTQAATGVRVLLRPDAAQLGSVLQEVDSVFIQTNSRALPEEAAVALVRSIRDDAREAGRRLGQEMQFVLRGDSTLRGHVFAEIDALMSDHAVILFVPAFPAGGRTTTAGVHYVEIQGQQVRADETEYAHDPVFPFDTANLAEYVRRKSTRSVRSIPLEQVRTPGSVRTALLTAADGEVVVPDATTNDDILRIALEVEQVQDQGRAVVIRCAAPLAAALAHVWSDALLQQPLRSTPGRTLVVCGSHTDGASRQLERLETVLGPPVVIDAEQALQDSLAAGKIAAAQARAALHETGYAIVATSRARSASHNTLAHGERVMNALVYVVQALRDELDVVVSKGGITSAEVARTGLGADQARVIGQVLPGVTIWSLTTSSGQDILYAVVPGNVGNDDTLVEVLAAIAR